MQGCFEGRQNVSLQLALLSSDHLVDDSLVLIHNVRSCKRGDFSLNHRFKDFPRVTAKEGS